MSTHAPARMVAAITVPGEQLGIPCLGHRDFSHDLLSLRIELASFRSQATAAPSWEAEECEGNLAFLMHPGSFFLFGMYSFAFV